MAPRHLTSIVLEQLRIFLLVLLATTLLTLLSARTALAEAPTHIRFPIDATLSSPGLTAACGFEVTVSYQGTYTATVFRDRAGVVTRELDTQPATVVSVGAPAYGTAFSFPFATIFAYDYPDGVSPGSPAIVQAAGLGDKVPGIPADAGVVVFDNAVVLFVRPDGIPIVDFGPPTAFRGSVVDPGRAADAVCHSLLP